MLVNVYYVFSIFMYMGKYSDATKLKDIVSKSMSLAQVLRAYGLADVGGNYKTLKKYLLLYGINTDHFTGQGWNTGSRYIPIKRKIPLPDILIGYSTFSTYHLKNRLLRDGVKSHQ